MEFAKAALGGISSRDMWDLYSAFDAAACQFVLATRCLHRSFTHEVADDIDDAINIPLPTDYLEVFTRNRANNLFFKYTDPDGGNHFVPFVPAETFFMDRDDPEIAPPSRFSVFGFSSPGKLQGTASTPARPMAGSVELVDWSASFITDQVSRRDEILNDRDGSIGVVESIPTETSVQAALFNGDTNDFAAEDDYLIIRQDRQLAIFDNILEPGSEVFIEYLSKPRPVFSLSASWDIPEFYHRYIASEGIYRFKMDYDYDPDRDMHLHHTYLEGVQLYREQIARQRIRKGPRTR